MASKKKEYVKINVTFVFILSLYKTLFCISKNRYCAYCLTNAKSELYQ